MNDIDVLVIGAGVLGLACAARLAEAGHGVLVAERERLAGSHTSSRNSEVIHAGLYYPPGSLKAELCVEGRERLYAWCARHGVGHRRIGKLLVAVADGEREKLQALHDNARACGVDDLSPLDGAGLRGLEPQVRGVAALFSPSTGIIDSHAFLQSLQAAAERRGAQLALDTRVDCLERRDGGWHAEGRSVGEPFQLRAGWVINAGGLFAQELAQRTEGLDPALVPTLHLCRGRYFSYSGRSPFRHLVYPMPEARTAGLGIHATLDLGGQLRFGPDVDYLERVDYRVDESLRQPFAQAISRYFPGLDPRRLVAGYAGIRPKLGGPGEPAADFVLQTPAEHGLPGLVNLFGIESPGLTASLALAERVARAL
ncbi:MULTISPECIES: NAD(P)/FAD-dependent oxidoreductase [Pseudomonas aeruginosa group]|uniref:Conserved exported protein n=1 Tax=Pseudomonas paraeruginosa TaxID=2994495 RepID=A0A2R3J1Y4_9PSED|nr:MULTISPECIES: NAD(P)/FAD-dependent oxidoreductase [Pseudomonas aeruginosa group]AVK08181.1 putative conserved exported protein [Pseudomonas paraeruginosa]AWE91995.1 putative conserved exported protein [Pseudomonas paraeruginosa]KSD65781.1 FAD-dependent oxidoreductase [Pseudomonas aeruginosa]KSF70378.1 FAD-dependent oxidoreductase [Pseudomonas aeruginosa]KSP91037.1 FAD-dependent oxidoreductase [Pseudomonas aeruginosa]